MKGLSIAVADSGKSLVSSLALACPKYGLLSLKSHGKRSAFAFFALHIYVTT